jgi:hypothetical protein
MLQEMGSLLPDMYPVAYDSVNMLRRESLLGEPGLRRLRQMSPTMIRQICARCSP